MIEFPDTRYAVGRGGAHIAYQVIGDGERDLIYVPSWASPIDLMWDHPVMARFLGRLASFSRLIIFDKHGSGSSDNVTIDALATLEDWADDILVVMEAVGSQRAAVVGAMVGAPISIMFAATYPRLISELVLVNASARPLADDDYPGPSPEAVPERLAQFASVWGTERYVDFYAPSMAHDASFRRWYAGFSRLGNPPAMATAVVRAFLLTDVRSILPAIQVPTLVVQRRVELEPFSPQHGKYLAEHIAGARYVEVPGNDYLVHTGEVGPILDEIQAFVTGERPQVEIDRVLATVLFTDIASSTELASRLGDREWRDLLERFRVIVRGQLDHFGGHEINTRGDDFLVTFDGPARAVRCAGAIAESVRGLNIEVRSGVHTGEVELLSGDVGGIAVHIGARISELACPGETLVSRTVTDLVAGSGISFDDRGQHELKGVPGSWGLFAVRG